MCQDQLVALLEASVEWVVSLIPSGQIIATLPPDLTPNGGLVGEIRLFQGKSIALGRILSFGPDPFYLRRFAFGF